MKFKIDENLPGGLAEDLRSLGHDAETVIEDGLAGFSDEDLMARTLEEGRIIFTLDKGIADVRSYPPERYPGIVLIRPSREGQSEILGFIRRHLTEILGLSLEGHLLVVTDRSIRIR